LRILIEYCFPRKVLYGEGILMLFAHEIKAIPVIEKIVPIIRCCFHSLIEPSQ
jgi:hypothetical protein